MFNERLLGDRYEIERELGAGSSAVVYLARDRRLDRLVALKVLRPELNDDREYVARFQTEARAAASLTHPNVVAIYDFGRGGAYNYIAMEYVAGGNLKALIERHGALSPAQAVPIAGQVLAALSAAHARGIVHRDVKPQNILLTGDQTAKVTDFGIAHLGNVGQTEKGLTLGTALYMSPEQALGERVTPASDIYSFGVVLFEMLAGVPPFGGANPVEVALRHVREDPPRLGALAPGIPARLEGIALRAMEKLPDRRWPSADVALAALADYQDQALQATGTFAPVGGTGVGRTTRIRPDELRPLPPSVPRRSWFARIVLVLLSLALLSGLGLGAYWLATYLPPQVTSLLGASSPTPAGSPTAIQVRVATQSPTPTPTLSPTETQRPTDTPPPAPTNTPAPAATETPAATATPVQPTEAPATVVPPPPPPPTATTQAPTPIPPTPVPVPPTATTAPPQPPAEPTPGQPEPTATPAA